MDANNKFCAFIATKSIEKKSTSFTQISAVASMIAHHIFNINMSQNVLKNIYALFTVKGFYLC